MAKQEIPFKASSNIQQIFHDPETQKLTVHFKTGGVYEYDGVDADKAASFSTADSAGQHLNAYIKGQHTFTKIG